MPDLYGNQLSEEDDLAVRRSSRHRARRGIRASAETLKEYAEQALLHLSESVSILQGLTPDVPASMDHCTYLDEHDREVTRLLKDHASGKIVLPWTPWEFVNWAEELNFPLSPAFVAKVRPPSSGGTSQQAPKRSAPSPRDASMAEVQKIARRVWAENPRWSIARVLREPAFNAYRREYRGANTLRGWISKVDPRPPWARAGRRRQGK